MATTDAELISEVRALTDYDIGIISDSKMQEIVNIGKEEITSHLDDHNINWYSQEYHDATRALYWFVVIGTKIHTGELASVNLTIGSIRATAYSENKFGHLFRSFDSRLRSAGGAHAVSAQIERDNRSYGG